MSKLMQALLIGLLYWFTQVKWFYTFQNIFRQPLTVSWFIGMLMGNVPQAIIIGANLQLVYMGMIAPGANIPADEALAACIAIPIALSTGMTPEMAVAFAVPFGILGVFLDQIRRTVNATWVHMADRYAEDCNIKGIYRAAWLWPALYQIPLRVIPVGLATYYGADAVTAFINSLPKWLLHGFEVTGGMLPALGFAITMMVIGKKNLLPYFIAGFFLMQYAKVPIMAAAIFGTVLAFLHVQFTQVRTQ